MERSEKPCIIFSETIRGKTKKWTRERYSMLDGIVLLDAICDLDDYQSEIDELAERTGLPILDRIEIGLDGLKTILLEALDPKRQKQVVNKEDVA